VETQNQRERRATRVPNGIAALLLLAHRTRFMIKNKLKTKLKRKHRDPSKSW
jgi:hypothetical protein